MLVQNLLSLLVMAVEHSDVNGIEVHRPRKDERCTFITYKYLLSLAEHRSKQLEKLESIDNRVVLMHFADHFDNIIWFWAIVAAGAVPCLCPLVKDLGQIRKNITHLQKLLKNPLVITTENLASELPKLNGLRVVNTGKSSNVWARLNVIISLSRYFLRQGEAPRELIT